VIRTATIDDSSSIARLSEQLGDPVTSDQVQFRLEKSLQDEESAIFLYETNQTIYGWVHVYGKCLIQLEYAEIGGLVVDAQRRNLGIGKKLMREAEEWARDKGYPELRLRSGGHRKEAHEFYKSIGYANIKSQQVFNLKL
jgi:GNAT superfamily N-acetyltransferase